jgi:hypothetical protein
MGHGASRGRGGRHDRRRCAGGVNWLIGIGGAGTAMGTLGLAYFTFTVAERTTELVDSSQRLEIAAAGELTAGREQAREAQRTRIDSLAPIPDLSIRFQEARVRLRVGAPPEPMLLRDSGHLNPDTLSFHATFELTLRNFGRAPAFFEFKYCGAALSTQGLVFRVDPAASSMISATLDYPGTLHDPFSGREVRFEIEVRGALSAAPVDTIHWHGEFTLTQWLAGVWQQHPDPLVPGSYVIERRYAEDARL